MGLGGQGLGVKQGSVHILHPQSPPPSPSNGPLGERQRGQRAGAVWPRPSPAASPGPAHLTPTPPPVWLCMSSLLETHGDAGPGESSTDWGLGPLVPSVLQHNSFQTPLGVPFCSGWDSDRGQGPQRSSGAQDTRGPGTLTSVQTFSPEGWGIWKRNGDKGLKAQVKSLERFNIAPAINKQASMQSASEKKAKEKRLFTKAKARKRVLQVARGGSREAGQPPSEAQAWGSRKTWSGGAPQEGFWFMDSIWPCKTLPLSGVCCLPASDSPKSSALGTLVTM